ncbi:MAG: isoprenylcysteine carboxylmethyltransferase family protein [Pseudomonadota bacterium]|nr:isoprenylcysteine carboxylmethyltransferase family protein [Pseudomonadota bacterium]
MNAANSEFTARGGWWVFAQIPVMLLASVAPLIWGAASFDRTNTIQLSGAALTALGLLLAIAGLVALRSALTPFPRPLANAHLLQSGIYAWVRHPIYGGLVIASFGWALSWLSLPGLLFSVIVLFFFDRKSAFEERLLRAHFP